MPRRKAPDQTAYQARTWAEWRIQNNMPESKRCRDKGKCFDCGEDYGGTDGHFHSRMEEQGRFGYVAYCCCRCVGHAG